MIGVRSIRFSSAKPPTTKPSTPKQRPMTAPITLRLHAHPFPAQRPYANANENTARPKATMLNTRNAEATTPTPVSAVTTA